MKIIDIGICVDNNDPKGIGRIRCVRYNDYVGEKEGALKYEKWDDKEIIATYTWNCAPDVQKHCGSTLYNLKILIPE